MTFVGTGSTVAALKTPSGEGRSEQSTRPVSGEATLGPSARTSTHLRSIFSAVSAIDPSDHTRTTIFTRDRGVGASPPSGPVGFIRAQGPEGVGDDRKTLSMLMRAAALAMSMLTVGATAVFADDISNNLDGTVDAVAEVMPLGFPGPNGTTSLYVIPLGGGRQERDATSRAAPSSHYL